jgi:Domain of unknown function (DUF5916)/Carbohydrate family 9 binding domain-like
MYHYCRIIFFILLSFTSLPRVGIAQTKIKNKPGLGLSIVKAKDPIVLDGKLDEPTWQVAAVAKDFFLNYPVDSLPPIFQSEARLAYDDHFLYVSFICYDDSKPDIVQSLRRDVNWDGNDNIGIYFDPYNDYTNGFFFTITPYGVQSEGVISGGGQDGDGSFSDSWDNKWYSHATRYPDKWIAELAIPFKSFRYSNNAKEWNVTFLRNDVKRNHVSSWIATPIQYIPASFAYTGKLNWETTAPHAGANISLIPYLAGSTSRDIEKNQSTQKSGSMGLDAKVALSPSLNLDLTINPDFSNVEVDQQVINLTRFEFQFPERRQFFLENSDLFSAPGYPPTRPFFSRRIGLARDSTGTAKQVPILYGARISGKLGKNWRLGIMNMRTEEKESLGLPAQMYSMAIVQRQVFSRSNIDFFIVDKESLGLGNYQRKKFYQKDLVKVIGADTLLNKFNRVIGVDFNLITKSNKWNGDFYYHQSLDAFHTDNNYSAGGFLGYNTRKISAFTGAYLVGKNYAPETGYVPGLDVYPGYLSGFGRLQTTSYPKKSKIATRSLGVETNYTIIPDGTLTDRTLIIDYQISYLNKSNLYGSASHVFQRLPEGFNPLYPRGDSTFLAGQEFQWTEFSLQYNSNTRKVFNFSAQASGGQYYTGTRQSYGGTLNYRYQPYGSLAVTFDYNNLQLGYPYGSTEFLLIRPRLDVTLSTKIFFTTVLQYNTRYESTNLNARLQWRFRPASDLFLVYSHGQNSFPPTDRTNVQALVLKFTYWLNL